MAGLFCVVIVVGNVLKTIKIQNEERCTEQNLLNRTENHMEMVKLLLSHELSEGKAHFSCCSVVERPKIEEKPQTFLEYVHQNPITALFNYARSEVTINHWFRP